MGHQEESSGLGLDAVRRVSTASAANIGLRLLTFSLEVRDVVALMVLIWNDPGKSNVHPGAGEPGAGMFWVTP